MLEEAPETPALLVLNRRCLSTRVGKRFNRSFVRTVRVFETALEPSKELRGENHEKGRFHFLRQTLICTKPWFKRDLDVRVQF